MAAALVILIWALRFHAQPTTFTLDMDSDITYYALRTGKGATLRHNQLLQQLFCASVKIKFERCHGLAVFFVHS